MDPFTESVMVRGFAAQYYRILYFFYGRGEDETLRKGWLDALETSLTKLIQVGISEGFLSPIGDGTDLAIANSMKLSYDEDGARLLIKAASPLREELYGILKKYGENNGSQ